MNKYTPKKEVKLLKWFKNVWLKFLFWYKTGGYFIFNIIRELFKAHPWVIWTSFLVEAILIIGSKIIKE